MNKEPRAMNVLIVVLVVLSLCLAPSVRVAAQADHAEVGEVVAARGDEVLQRAGATQLQMLAVGQILKSGDTIKTGPYGGAAVLFNDDTQVRIHRNSTFKVESVRGGDGVEESRFALISGAAWSRAKALFRTVTAGVQRGRRPIVSVRTPSATLGIRGTDWHVSVDAAGRTTATVLSGEVELGNELGAVSLTRGEVGTAEHGQAPAKRAIVDLRDRPLIVLQTGPEWLEMLRVGGGDTGGDDTLTKAEQALDSGDYAAADNLLKGDVASPRAALVTARVALHGRDYARAEQALAVAATDSDARRVALAKLTAVGVLVEQHRFGEADAAMAALATSAGDLPDTQLVRAWLSSFAGDHATAIEVARAAAARFSGDARFETLLAHLYFLTDARDDMQAAVGRALALDAKDHLAWYEQGLYHQYSEPDAARALAAYTRSLELRPGFAPAYEKRGLVNNDIGDYRAAVRDLKAALAADPGSASAHANYGLVAAYLGRLDEARSHLEQAQTLNADEAYAGLGLAYLDLLGGAPSKAVDKTLKALVANPELPGIDWFLAAATYQSGDYARTRQALDTARQRDPDDPIPDLIGSVTAVDHFEAGEAIREARRGFEKTLRAKSFAVDTLANARGGSATLGQAYSNLGLDEWGGYYSMLAFDPYEAGGYFYLSQANQFASERARLGANLQGLLLDPTAVSFPTRYYEPFRQERHDVTLAGTLGYNDGGFIHSGGGSVQGLLRRPDPIAYYIAGSHEHDDGNRDDNASGHQSLQVQLGSSLLDQSHNLLFNLSAQHFNQQLPGTASDGDPDDAQMNQFLFADLGYQYRVNYHNRIMARVAGGYETSRFSNGSPFGRGLGSRDYSLLRTFGRDTTRGLYGQGLFDVTDLAVATINQPPSFPVLFTGPLSDALCGVLFNVDCPATPDNLAAAIDDDATLNDTTNASKLLFQLRQMFDAGPLELTYGAGYGRFDEHTVLNAITPRLFGIANLFGVGVDVPACPDIGVANPVGQCAFVWTDAVGQRISEDAVATSLEVYGQARWKLTPDLWLEGGVFYRDISLGANDKHQFDPRIGAAWRITPHHWLRASSQSALIDSLRTQDTLAPVGILGAVVPDAYFSATDTLAATWYHQLRWDAEWSSRVYTFVQVDRQDVEDFALGFVPDSRFTIFGHLADGRLDTVSFGTNVWLAERIGWSASYKHLWSENRSQGAERGRDLPLIPEQEFHTGLTWVHPKAVTLGIGGNYTGERMANLNNSRTLAGYWTAGAFANWQPFNKHLSLTLAADNLFDADYELAEGFTGVGTTVLMSAEYRF
jgi:tetratricopeptide (TPR) repeat protein